MTNLQNAEPKSASDWAGSVEKPSYMKWQGTKHDVVVKG